MITSSASALGISVSSSIWCFSYLDTTSQDVWPVTYLISGGLLLVFALANLIFIAAPCLEKKNISVILRVLVILIIGGSIGAFFAPNSLQAFLQNMSMSSVQIGGLTADADAKFGYGLVCIGVAVLFNFIALIMTAVSSPQRRDGYQPLLPSTNEQKYSQY